MNGKPVANQRKFMRGAQRIPCQIVVAGEARKTIVLDLSATGIFLQLSRSTLKLVVDEKVTVILDMEPQPVTVEAVVARIQKSHRAVASVQPSGVGLRVVSAPEEYFQFLMELC